jgi:hypothetical protein
MTTKMLLKMGTSLQFAGIIAGVCCGASRALADLEVSASVQIHAKGEFEAPLAAHGSWVEVGSYGRCWHPVGVAVEWRPYCTGEWVWTDCGWYWESDEPWGWACYHYGYWVNDAAYGWVWVPGIEWAPAWVSWRVGGGFIGWAPLPPPGFFFAARPKAEVFVFIDSGRFGNPVRPSSVIFKNSAIFSKTAEVGGVKRETRNGIGVSSQRVMVNQGPKVEEVQRFTGKSFRTVPIQEAARRTVPAASPKHGGPETKSKAESHDPKVQSAHDADRGGRDDVPGGDRSGPSSGSFWRSGGPSGGHGNGGGGHDRGRN